jgi:hypothetical protein
VRCQVFVERFAVQGGRVGIFDVPGVRIQGARMPYADAFGLYATGGVQLLHKPANLANDVFVPFIGLCGHALSGQNRRIFAAFQHSSLYLCAA